MGTELKKYRPDQVTIALGNIIVEGFAKGSFVTVEHDEERFKYFPGSDGGGTRVKNSNRAGTIKFKIQQSSLSNAELTALAELDHSTPGGVGVVPIMVKDNSGYSLHSAFTAWIEKPPSGEYSDELTDREWTIRTNDLNNYNAGN